MYISGLLIRLLLQFLRPALLLPNVSPPFLRSVFTMRLVQPASQQGYSVCVEESNGGGGTVPLAASSPDYTLPDHSSQVMMGGRAVT